MTWAGSTCLVFAGMTVAACAGAPRAAPPVPAPPAPAPKPLPGAPDPAMRRLLLDTVTRETCPKSVHKLLGLPSSDDAAMIGPQAGLARVSGRWLVQECADQGDDSGHSFALGGPGWMWIDQTLKGVRIHQYVYFFARASITGSLDVAYDESAKVASVWLIQTAAPTMAFTPFSGVNAHVQNPLARVLGATFPSGADATASTSADAIAAERFRDVLLRGVTITHSTASGQMDLMLGRSANGVIPQRPSPAPRWLLNERQELHAGGFQIAGPFAYTQTAQLDALVETGSDMHYATVCADAATLALTDLASGQTPAVAKAVPTTYVPPTQRYSARLTPPLCEWVLVTYSRSDTTVTLAVTP